MGKRDRKDREALQKQGLGKEEKEGKSSRRTKKRKRPQEEPEFEPAAEDSLSLQPGGESTAQQKDSPISDSKVSLSDEEDPKEKKRRKKEKKKDKKKDKKKSKKKAED